MSTPSNPWFFQDPHLRGLARDLATAAMAAVSYRQVAKMAGRSGRGGAIVALVTSASATYDDLTKESNQSSLKRVGVNAGEMLGFWKNVQTAEIPKGQE